jgi:hypothetical protein
MRTLLIMVVLLGVPIAAGVNYMRNEPLDEELKDRPYAGITDAELEALLGAYKNELGRSAVEAEPGTDAFNDPARFADYEEKVQAFEKFQDSNESWKHARGQLFGKQTTLQVLQHEASIRARGLHRPLPRIWRRISTF